MKSIIKFAALFLLVSVCFTACGASRGESASAVGQEKQLFLVLGFDDAAENTDVIFTVGYDRDNAAINVVQIPRDTYVFCGTTQNKLNQIYAAERAGGADSHKAMAAVSRTLAATLGVSFDGCIGITTNGFRGIVKAVGGVDVELPSDMEIVGEDGRVLRFKAGVNHLDETEAELFVRHRSGYATGDIGRLDAQKLFLSAMLKKSAGGASLPTLISLYTAIRGEVVTDVDAYSLMKIALAAIKDKDSFSKTFVTAPGEPAVSESGLSYYVINKKNMEEVVRKYMFASAPFDAHGVLTRADYPSFNNIYEDKNAYYRVYTDDGVMDIRIPGS